jgi:hypothetical protein
MKQSHSQNSIFLMEIILNVLLFSILLVVGLQFFIHSHTLTEKTQQLHQAVSGCESVAAVFESGDGNLDDLVDTYQYSVNLHSQVLIYLDSNFNECQKQNACYYISASLSSDSTDTLEKATITCYTIDATQLYTLRVCHYTPLQARNETLTRQEVG